MNKVVSLLAGVLLLCIGCTAQRGDTLRRYMDAQLVFTGKKNFTYPGVVIKQGDHWMYVAVYPDTGVLVKAYAKDNDIKVKDGPFIFYHLKNVKAMEGRYANNIRQGVWQTWYANRQLKDSGMIKNNFLTGVWKSWYENGTLAVKATYPAADSIPPAIHSPVTNRKHSLFEGDTMVMLKHGNWQSYFANGQLHDSGRYVNNVKTGLWKSWYENGLPESMGWYTDDVQNGDWEYFRKEGTRSTQENYKDGKIVSMACYDEQGNFTGSFCSILKPPVPLLDRYVDLNNYVLDHVTWPADVLYDNKVQGIVKVQFTITKQGELIGFKILSSPHKSLSREVEHFFSSLPPWSPAVSHNRVINYTMEYEIPFLRQK